MIEVANRQRRVAVRAGQVRAVVQAVFAAEQAGEPRVSVALVNDATIRQVNRDFLDHDWATDAIAFSYADDPVTGGAAAGGAPGDTAEDGEGGARAGGGPGMDGCADPASDVTGEVVVSAETALREAGERGHDPAWELLLYVAHGTLHLLGWDDDTPARRQAMNARAAGILAEAGFAPAGEAGP